MIWIIGIIHGFYLASKANRGVIRECEETNATVHEYVKRDLTYKDGEGTFDNDKAMPPQPEAVISVVELLWTGSAVVLILFLIGMYVRHLTSMYRDEERLRTSEDGQPIPQHYSIMWKAVVAQIAGRCIAEDV